MTGFVHFIGPLARDDGEGGDRLVARTEVERLGDSLAFADCTITAGDREIVRARGVFAVLS